MAQFLDGIKFDEKGLIPAVLQNSATGEVLMVAYMNEESLEKTLKTGNATFWSRSRQEIWEKGATSGNYMHVESIRLDCDGDCLLVSVKPSGAACHTGNNSCFFRCVSEDGVCEEEENALKSRDILLRLCEVTQDRKTNPVEGSYTNYLLAKGEDKIIKKVGEEAAEVIIAAKNRSYDEIKYEVADLMYHLTVMLVDNDMSWQDVFEELESRR